MKFYISPEMADLILSPQFRGDLEGVLLALLANTIIFAAVLSSTNILIRSLKHWFNDKLKNKS